MWSGVTLVERRRGEGEREAKFYENCQKCFRVTPNVAIGTRQQQEPEVAVSVSEEEMKWRVTGVTLHHKDVSIKAVENYIK